MMMRLAASALLLLASTSLAQEVDERAILKEFYAATGGDSWQDNSGWNQDDNNICEWHGIVCSGEGSLEGSDLVDVPTTLTGSVAAIELKNNNMNGRTPDSMYTLPSLQLLHFSGNANLDVSFNNIGAATQLDTIKIHNTATTTLNGIGNVASSLKRLHVAGMALNSVIPEEIWTLVNLQELILAEMNLEGPIPAAIGNLKYLTLFNVYENKMTGRIPDELVALEDLRSFTLSRNQFTGTLPEFINNFDFMEEFYVEQNQFEGPILSFNHMEYLTQMYLSNNYLTGSIPNDFLARTANSTTNGNITVDLADNRLTGELPAALDNLQNLNFRFNFADNRFSSINPVLCDNANWEEGTTVEFSCDALMCPIGTFNPTGRRTPDQPCQPCQSAEYMGQSTCSDRNDVGVLTLLYQSTGGDDWYNNDGWLTDADICEWYGITCWEEGADRIGRVRHIHLDNNNLVGSIPQNVYALETLTTMTFSRNKIVLPFEQIANSPHMHHINIAATKTTQFNGIGNANDFFKHLVADKLLIQGTIPREIFDITSLTTLSMAECELTGLMEEEISKMQSLEKLYLYGNNLRGPIPESLGNMANLQIVSLAKNQLTGVLPNSLNNLENLTAFAVTDQVNKGGGITGSVPSFSNNRNLTMLLLGKNRLEGTLPSNLLNGAFDLNALLTVDVSNNLLTGTVPGGLARFDRMELNLENNLFTDVDEKLCGIDGWQGGNVGRFGCDALLCPQFTTSPTGRRNYDSQQCVECTDEAASVYLGQTFCGPTQYPPTERQILQLVYDVCGGSNWKESGNWDTNENICDWYGIECDEANSVVSIVLGDNGLTGTVPSEVFKLPNLNRISLFSNEIDFTFEGIENARNLREIVLDSTNLDSLEGVGLGRTLTILNVRGAKLHGSVPEELSRLVNLETLILSDNKFSGHLPNWLNQLPRLEGLMIARNELSGPLMDFGGFENIMFLDLGENKLEGTIPGSFLINANRDNKIFVDLSHNKLKGVVPAELARLKELVIHLKENKFTDVDPALCELGGWNNGAVLSYGCNGIMCPAHTYNGLGRQQDNEPCLPCPKSSKYLGSVDCHSAAGRLMAFGSGMLAVATAVAMLF